MRLRCPVCGQSPLFVQWRSTRTIYDWITPLDGCPNCGAAFDREAGYWLVPVWILNFGWSTFVGLVVGSAMREMLGCSIWTMTFAGMAATGIAAFLSARHAKAIFLAVDQFIDPDPMRPQALQVARTK